MRLLTCLFEAVTSRVFGAPFNLTCSPAYHRWLDITRQNRLPILPITNPPSHCSQPPPNSQSSSSPTHPNPTTPLSHSRASSLSTLSTPHSLLCVVKKRRLFPRLNRGEDVPEAALHQAMLHDVIHGLNQRDVPIGPLFADERWRLVRSSAPRRSWLSVLRKNGLLCGEEEEAAGSVDPVDETSSKSASLQKRTEISC